MKAHKILMVIIVAIALTGASMAKDAPRYATIARLSGVAEVMKPDGAWIEAHRGMSLPQGSSIRTKEGANMALSIDGRSQTALVEVKQNTTISLAELTRGSGGAKKTLLDLAIGDVLIKVKKMPSEESKFEVRTPISYIGVRGTIFSVSLKRSE